LHPIPLPESVFIIEVGKEEKYLLLSLIIFYYNFDYFFSTL